MQTMSQTWGRSSNWAVLICGEAARLSNEASDDKRDLQFQAELDYSKMCVMAHIDSQHLQGPTFVKCLRGDM